MKRFPDEVATRLSAKLTRVSQFFSEDVHRFTTRLRELETEIDENAVPQRNDRFHRAVLEAFRDSQDACRRFELDNQEHPEVILDVQEGFRRVTDQWFSRSWIANRARTKPSGFPGDFEMLIKLYEEATPARGLGGYLDLCILDLPLACAVRTRLAAARQFLIDEVGRRNGTVRVLDVACGPCREYRNWPDTEQDSGSRHLEIVAMDSDPKALEYVEDFVAPDMPPSANLMPVRYNALRTRSAQATTRKFGQFDILYSVGLCDYLSDEHLIAMLGAWRDTLRDGGVLYVAFKDTERYDKTPYQWHLDWYFFQRTRDDVLRLYEQAGFDPNTITTTRDGTGIIINFIDRRARDRNTRLDSAEPGIHRMDDRQVRHTDE